MNDLHLVNVEVIDNGRRMFGKAVISGAALATLATVPGCTTTTSGNVTTITLNVAKVEAYGQAGLNAAATVTSLLSGISAVEPYVAIITTAETALSSALSTFTTAAGSTVTISYDDTNWKTRVDSILTGVETLGTTIDNTISAAGSNISSSVKSDATTALSALKTVASVFEALLTTSVSAKLSATSDTTMTEAQALQILGVSR